MLMRGQMTSNARSYASGGSLQVTETTVPTHLLRFSKMNYHHWTMMMECYLEVQGWADVIKHAGVPRKMDH